MELEPNPLTKPHEASPQVGSCTKRQSEVTIARVCSQAGQAMRLNGQAPLRDALDVLREQSELIGLLIEVEPGQVVPMYRIRTYQLLTRAYVKDLFSHKPITAFLRAQHGMNHLRLDAATPIGDAIDAALARDVEYRYDPVIVTRGGVCREVLDVRAMIDHQRCMLADVLDEVDRQRQEAHHASRHDRLTGLPNRTHSLERLQEAANDAEARSKPYALLFLDFDRFKIINDSLGHDAGDQLLTLIARRMMRTLEQFTGQKQDAGRWLAARLGGDEFLVLLENLQDPGEPTHLAQQLIDAMRPPFNVCGHEVTTSPSIGVTTSATSASTVPGTLLRDADAAMYRAKNAGRNRYAVFDQSMHEQSLHRLRLENELRRALDRGEMTMFYQPIVASESGEITGFEALMRWFHPQLGEVSPGTFIPVAEENGMISALGSYALETALHQLADWRREVGNQRPMTMSVNVSKRQIFQPDFIDHLRQTIQQTGINPRDVNLEITESIVSGRSDEIVSVLNRVKAMGIRLSMDDFGTGMSSLTCLHRFPIDVLKIDRSFIKHLEKRTAYTAVVQAIVTLARNLGMSVTVEGVERMEQLAQVQALDCDQIQGYLFSRPVPAADAARLLRYGITLLEQHHAA